MIHAAIFEISRNFCILPTHIDMVLKKLLAFAEVAAELRLELHANRLGRQLVKVAGAHDELDRGDERAVGRRGRHGCFGF